jgi:phosphoglycerate kinase
MSEKKTLRDIDVAGKRVFVRVDFNVPLQDGMITDDTRIKAAVPTIAYLLDEGAAVILASHLGRPKGRAVESLSMGPVAQRLSRILGKEVNTVPDSAGPEVEALAAQLQPGDVLLLENLRFHPEEEENDAGFARALASLADVYVNDAFGAAHRAHASTASITKYLPSVSGFLMERELNALGRVLHDPRRPLVAVIGGAKISTKTGVLEHLLGVADAFLIGGGMANTLLRAKGLQIGASLIEEDKVGPARAFLEQAQAQSVSVMLPTDVVVADEVGANADTRVVSANDVPAGSIIVDIGPESIRQFAAVIRDAGTVFWNGPMGIFEIPRFSEGTRALAVAVAESSADTVVGGGDSVAAVEEAGVADSIGHISTGGGASLEFLEGRDLPGVAALDDVDEVRSPR